MHEFNASGVHRVADQSAIEMAERNPELAEIANGTEVSTEVLETLPTELTETIGEMTSLEVEGSTAIIGQASTAESIEAATEGITQVEEEMAVLTAEEGALPGELAVSEEAISLVASEVAAAETTVEVTGGALAAAITAEETAAVAEAGSWWTVVGGIIAGAAIAAAAAAIIIAKKNYDEAQEKKKDAEKRLKELRDDHHKKLHKRNHLGADRTRLETRKHYLEQEKAGKIHQNEKTKNKIEACKKMHTAYSLKVWFIRYWLAKNNKPIPDIPDEPCPPKHVVLHHAEEGDGHSPIPNGIKGLIHNYEESDRKFTNAQYIGCYGSGNKVRVVWEHVNSPGNKLKSLENVKIWASNNGVSDSRHSQCGLWGITNDSAYMLALAAVGRHPEMYEFYKDGKNVTVYAAHISGFTLSDFDSVILCIRSAPWAAWQAACQKYEIDYYVGS